VRVIQWLEDSQQEDLPGNYLDVLADVRRSLYELRRGDATR
jgi:hypothetical protein